MSSCSQKFVLENGVPTVEEGALLTVSGVGFDYESIPVLDNVDLSVNRGEFVALIGPSGCGKSTLLNLISGLIPPTTGNISVNGIVDSSGRLGNVSYMQQADLLLPWRTITENCQLGLELRHISADISKARIQELAKSFGLSDVLAYMPWQLSGGMRQRAALMRTVLPDNHVLLLDEPFGALDAITRNVLQKWLLSVLVRADKAVLLVTHDVEEAILLADRVLIMASDPGRIIAEVDVRLPDSNIESSFTSPAFVELRKNILTLLERRGVSS